MSTRMIQITPNPTPGEPAVFAAATANAGDTVSWHNADAQAHWPAPSANNKTGWFPFQTPGGATSDTLALGPGTPPTETYVLNYVCGNHADEAGTITVNPQP